MRLYLHSFKKSTGEEYPVETLKGKVVLIVNTATKCGLAPQFAGLEMIHSKYKDSGVVVLGFPCNQFGNQEPETNESMAESCQINHGVTFQLLEKIKVNGSDAHPLYKWLKSTTTNWFRKKIKWNFTKFLIDQEGNVVKRYAPTKKPEKIIEEIEKLLLKGEGINH